MPDNTGTSNLPRRAVLGAVGDLHVGSIWGLCPPTGILRDGGGRYLPNPIQVWMWERWLDFWIEFYATDPGAPHVVLVNAEFIDGNHHGTTEIATPEPAEQAAAALEVMRPVLRNAAALIVTRGTEAHSGKAGAADRGIAAALKAQGVNVIVQPDPGASEAEHELVFDLCGVRFDVAHHVGGTRVPHTRGNNIRSEVNQAIHDYAEIKQRLPDILIRGHVHNLADTGENFPIYGVVLPAWQTKTAFAHRVTRQKVTRVGGLICECTGDGNYHKRVRTWKVPRLPVMEILTGAP